MAVSVELLLLPTMRFLLLAVFPDWGTDRPVRAWFTQACFSSALRRLHIVPTSFSTWAGDAPGLAARTLSLACSPKLVNAVHPLAAERGARPDLAPRPGGGGRGGSGMLATWVMSSLSLAGSGLVDEGGALMPGGATAWAVGVSPSAPG